MVLIEKWDQIHLEKNYLTKIQKDQMEKSDIPGKDYGNKFNGQYGNF